jgi:hypothetical protein
MISNGKNVSYTTMYKVAKRVTCQKACRFEIRKYWRVLERRLYNTLHADLPLERTTHTISNRVDRLGVVCREDLIAYILYVSLLFTGACPPISTMHVSTC